MKSFLARRFISSVLSLVGATFLVFAISQAAEDPLNLYAKPGGYGMSPEQREALRIKLGLDKHVTIQYALWLGRAMRGDLGNSIFDELPVRDKIENRIGATLKLGVFSWAFATILGIPLGILSAVKRATLMDYFGRGFALFGSAIPNFWLAIVLILLFSVQLGWLPSSTLGDGFISIPHLILPVFVLGTATAAGYLRITRSAMLEILDSEFVKLARAKGVSDTTVVWKHAFRNALIPPLTVSAVLMASFITGSLITESVFAISGLGSLAIQSVNNNDFPLLAGITLVFTAVWVTVNFLSDVAYVIVDPRIRLS
ncbi:MAG: ABC transporter permease [Dehalococcoidia bacterium]